MATGYPHLMHADFGLCDRCPVLIADQRFRRQAALALLLTIPAGSMFSAGEMVSAFGVSLEPLKKRLEKLRADSDDWTEAQNPRKGEPRLLYTFSAVESLLRELLAPG